MNLDLVAQIESRAYAAWPAATEHREDGWVLRTAGGFSRRLNSVQAEDRVEAFDARLLRAEAYYTQRGLPIIFRVTPLCAAVDEPLESRGFIREAETDVMVADRLPEGSGNVRVAARPSAAWIESQERWLGISGRAAWEAILHRASAGAGETGFGLLLDDAVPAAAGLAVVDSGWVGLFEITVAPDRRGRGLGRTITQGLLAWGRRAGARRSYLQVQQSNAAARRLYDSLGFVERYSYWYRRAPAPPDLAGAVESHQPSP